MENVTAMKLSNFKKIIEKTEKSQQELEELEKIATKIANYEKMLERKEISQEDIEKDILKNTKNFKLEDFILLDEMVQNLLTNND